VLSQVGPLDDAVEVLRESAEIGEGATAALARVLLAKAQALRGKTTNLDLLAVLEAGVDELERLDERRALAEALTVLALALFWVGRLDECRNTAERALAYARETGDIGSELVAIREVGTATLWNATPWPEIERTSRELLAGADRLGSRVVAWALDALGRAAWHQGDFDEGRRLLAEAMRIHQELGIAMSAATLHMEVGFMELNARDLDAAERELRQGWEKLGELGEEGIRSTTGALLAETLVRQGRLAEADEVADETDRIGVEDDFVTVGHMSLIRGYIASRRGDHDRAIDLARRALAIVDGSEYVPLHAEARIGLGEVLLAAGRLDEAVAPLTRAIAIAEAKQDRVFGERARDLLEQALAAPTRD
jgi:tetratricopeptide (TPR) repeat protein